MKIVVMLSLLTLGTLTKANTITGCRSFPNDCEKAKLIVEAKSDPSDHVWRSRILMKDSEGMNYSINALGGPHSFNLLAGPHARSYVIKMLKNEKNVRLFYSYSDLEAPINIIGKVSLAADEIYVAGPTLEKTYSLEAVAEEGVSGEEKSGTYYPVSDLIDRITDRFLSSSLATRIQSFAP